MTPRTKFGKDVIKNNPVTITHTIKIAGWNLTAGSKLLVCRIYFRNGETQLEGYIDGSENKTEVPSMWTDIEYE